MEQLFNERYRLIERKGSGSFGEVWLARDEQLGMDVAVKMYIALDDRGIEEFKKEYRTAYNLNHPNLLHAYHFDICDRRPFLVMPYCPDSATSLIGNCDNGTLWKFIKDVSSGLSYLHSLDIVHHDIKPDNILITKDGRFVITDFGISTNMRSTLRRNSTRSMNQNSSGGSLPYMGPEMFTSRPESVKATDIWAFGVTLYELITGELPFFGQGGVMMLRGAEAPELDCQDENIVALVRACLSKETWDRPTAEEIVTMAETECFIGRKKEEPKKKDDEKTVNFSDAGNHIKSVFDGLRKTPSSKASVQEESNPAKSRNWFVNTWIWIVILLNLALTVLYIYLVQDSYEGITQYRIIGLCCILAALGGWMMWKNLRTGYWIFAIVQTISAITSLTLGNIDNANSVESFLGNFIGLAAAFGILQIRKKGISAWKQMNYGFGRMPIIYSFAAVFVFFIIVFPNSNAIESRNDFQKYQEHVDYCLDVIYKEEATVEELLEARRRFTIACNYENQYKGVNKNYNNDFSIRPILKSKLQTESEKWSKAADVQKRLGNKDKADEFRKIASQLSLE